MLKVELITVPGSGTRSIERYMTKHWNFILHNYPWKDGGKADQPMVFTSTHFEPDRRSMDRLLGMKDTIILSTWRDPLRTTIHNLYKGRKHIMTCFHMLQELRAKRPVFMIDMKCVPYTEGEYETLHPLKRVANDGNALRKAYEDREIGYIDKVMGDYLKQLREFDWKDLWTEDWWR